MTVKAVVLGLALAAGAATASAETFKFVAIGDMPYGDPVKTYPPFRALIGAINARQPAFTIHVGDIKSGSTLCTDALFQEQLDFLNSFETALVYTPGDNEWTDCHRDAAGKFDPLERLAKLRAMFFTGPQSLGRAPLALERQGDLMPDHRTFVENARFVKAGILFTTLHVVGSNNNLEPRDRRAANEFFDRDQANVAWLREPNDDDGKPKLDKQNSNTALRTRPDEGSAPRGWRGAAAGRVGPPPAPRLAGQQFK